MTPKVLISQLTESVKLKLWQKVTIMARPPYVLRKETRKRAAMTSPDKNSTNVIIIGKSCNEFVKKRPLYTQVSEGKSHRVIELVRPRVRSVLSLPQFNDLISLLLHSVRKDISTIKLVPFTSPPTLSIDTVDISTNKLETNRTPRPCDDHRRMVKL